MDLGWFGCVCCPAAWELLRAGSTCPCQNVHRDIIPCNSLLRQKGVEKSCWLESWILSMAFHNAVWLISMVKIRQLFPSYTGMTKATTWQTEWAVMAVNYVQSHWSCWIVLSPNLRAVCKRLQRTLLGQLAMCVNDATTRLCEFWTCGNFNSASIWLIGIRRQDVFYNCHGKWDACWIGMDLGWFGCVCCPAAWELLRAGSTCPCQNVHRDIIPCNSLLRQKGVEKSCWLESWILSMAFHNAVWLISMVKIRQLFPSYTGMTKATTWQTEWAVMAVNYVQSHWSCWIVLSPNLRAVCKRLQRTLLGQLAMCVNDATTRLCDFERAEISILLPFDSLGFEGKCFCNCYLKWDQSI